MTNDRFKQRLTEIVGSQYVLDAEDLSGRDPGIDPSNFDAGLAVQPQSTKEIAEILSLCNATGVPIVTQGGRTGLAGAATSSSGQLIVDTHRLTDPCEIEPEGQTATVGAGVTLQSLNDAAAEHGLCAGIDIGSRGTTTIGGMLATNAGGGEAFRNGVMRHRLLGLEAVTATGTIMSDLKRVTKANEGLDIKQLFVGSEGTLGIITRAVLKLERLQGTPSTALVACDTAAEALRLFHALNNAPDCELAKAEIMWRDYARTTALDLDLSPLLSFTDPPVYVIFEATLRASARSDFETMLATAMENVDLADAIIAQNERERADIWRIREDSWGVQRQYPDGIWFDVSVPLPDIDSYLNGAIERVTSLDPELGVFVMGHLGDGNLHFTITKGTPIDHMYDQVSSAIYDGLAELGGSFSAEHGIGTEKKSALSARCDSGKLALMAAIKQALDPNGIMNPGKVID